MNNQKKNLDIQELYIKFKHILSGCRTILDAFYFADKFIRAYPGSNELLNSMIQGKHYDSVLDFRTIRGTLIELDTYLHREEIDEYINKISRNNNDSIQTRSLLRISKTKPVRSSRIETAKIYEFKKEIFENLTNICPHCKKVYNGNDDSEYVICGYGNTHIGYDWDGCGKDWCFKCGKKLCKTWDSDQLFIESNRTHDASCCKKHAEEHNFIYPTEYCFCINKYVQRI